MLMLRQATDRAALVALYETTGGPDWTRNDNWLTDKPLNEWYGIGVDDSDRVTGIRLRENGLEGTLPKELGDLGGLRYLHLGDNALNGPIPAELGGLGRLGALFLRDNNLSGPLPEELAELDSLRGFWVANNGLEGVVPRGFRNLGLLFFDIEGNDGLCLPTNPGFVNWVRRLLLFGGSWCGEKDAEVLRALYEATGGDNWTSSDGWLEGTNASGWHGVETDSLGRVAGLDLSRNGLSGSLPEELGDLASLITLDVSGNRLAGRLPERLGDLANLVSLNLSANYFSGPLPLSLRNTALDELKYEYTRLCIPDDRAFRNWLGSIGVHEGTGEVCAPLSDREILEALYEAAGGENWTNNHNWLTDAPLGAWYGVNTDRDGNVTQLSLSGNLLVGKIPPELGQLAHLEYLHLGYNYHLEGPIPPEFFDLSELRWLYLLGSSMGGLPPDIGRLVKLETLNLRSTSLTGHIPPELGDLTELRYLDLRSNYLFGEIPPELGNLAKLEHLRLYFCELTGSIPPELGRLSSLQVLDLGYNHLTGDIPAELGNLSNLTGLDLRSNELTGSIPVEWGNLDRLEWMYLADNQLSGGIPASFEGLGAITNLRLENNLLEGPLPPGIGELANVQYLWVGNNAGLSGPVPTGLAALEHLESLKTGGTDLCAPQDTDFLDWLNGVPFHRLARCELTPAYLTQSVQSREFPVPLVPGRPALLRVFLSSRFADGEELPEVRATFFRNNREIHMAEIAAGSGVIPNEVDEGSLSSSVNADIPGWVVRPGLEMVIDVDPDGDLDSGLGIPKRIPATGRMPVDVADLDDLQLTLVPFLWEADPDSSILEITEGMADDPDGHPMFEETRTFLPVGGWDIELHDPVVSSTNNGFIVRNETEAIRRMEGRPGYWLSMMGPVKASGLFGVAYGIPSWTSFSIPVSPTVAHELGHNMGLWHAPCGGAGGPDPLYPHEWGTIGSWGYDREHERLVTPHAPDLMSYCGGQWISDYHRANAVRHRMNTEGAVRFGTKTRSVMVWGGLDAVGVPYLEPSFIADALPSLPPSGNDFIVTGRTEGGNEAFSWRFDMPVTLDVDDERTGFVFAVPITWEGELESITLAGSDGSAILDEDTNQPITILRDPVTGQVRAILRRSVESAMAEFGEPGMEVLFSRGVPR